MQICKYCGAEIKTEDVFCSKPCRKFHSRNTKPKKYLRHCGVPERYLDASFENYKGEQSNVEKLRNATGYSIYIYGGTGVGKTYLAASYIRYMADKMQEKGLFVNATGLFIELRQAISEGREFECLRKYTSGNLLVIDDIGTEKLSDYVLQSWYYLLNERYNLMLPTLLTSNLDLQGIADNYGSIGDRIASRIATGRNVIKLNDKDYRLT